MIFTFLLNIAYNLLVGWISTTSSIASLPPALISAFAYAVSAINSLNYLIPTDALFASLAIVVGFELAFWLFRAAVWVYRHIPFIGH